MLGLAVAHLPGRPVESLNGVPNPRNRSAPVLGWLSPLQHPADGLYRLQHLAGALPTQDLSACFQR
jgi:hypothetical protein